MDCSAPGSFVHGISQARMLEWVPSLGDLPDPGTGPASPALAGKIFTTEPASKPPCQDYNIHNFDTDLN